jgi:hypothetical protein
VKPACHLLRNFPILGGPEHNSESSNRTRIARVTCPWIIGPSHPRLRIRCASPREEPSPRGNRGRDAPRRGIGRSPSSWEGHPPCISDGRPPSRPHADDPYLHRGMIRFTLAPALEQWAEIPDAGDRRTPLAGPDRGVAPGTVGFETSRDWQRKNAVRCRIFRPRVRA